MFIVSEVLLVFTFLKPDPATVFFQYRCPLVLFSVGVFAAAVFQYHLVFKLDEDTAKGHSNKDSDKSDDHT